MVNESLLRLLHPYQRATAEMIGVNLGAGAGDARGRALTTLAALALMHGRAVIVEPTAARRQETDRTIRTMAPSSPVGGLGSGAAVEVATYHELERAMSDMDGVPYDLVVLRERPTILDASAADILSWVTVAGRDVLVIDETFLAAPVDAAVPAAVHAASA